MGETVADSAEVRVRTRNAECVTFLALSLLARLIFYCYGMPAARPPFSSSIEHLPPPLRPISSFVLIAITTVLMVLPGIWFSEQIKLAPSPLLRKWLNRQPIARHELTRLASMIPAGLGLFVFGIAGALISMALGASAKPTGTAAVALSIMLHVSPLGSVAIGFASAVYEELFIHLTILTAIAYVISRFWHAPDGTPTAAAMWLAIVLQAPIGSVLNLQGRQRGVFLMLDVHTAYGVIFGWLYWRYGLEASLIATWTLVSTASGVGALLARLQRRL